MRTRSFRHSTDIRRDDRMADLLAVHGPAGYGVYWMIIEILHSHEDMQVPYTGKTIRRMAARIGMKHEEFHNMLQDMIVDYDLFEVVDFMPGIEQQGLPAGQAGYLRSTIIYRKPRKQKQTAVTPAETSDTEIQTRDNINSKIQPGLKPGDRYNKQPELSEQPTSLANDLYGPPPAIHRRRKPDVAKVLTSP